MMIFSVKKNNSTHCAEKIIKYVGKMLAPAEATLLLAGANLFPA